MGLKQSIKRMLVGSEVAPRKIRGGTLRGHQFIVDPATDTMKVYGLWETEIVPDIRRLTAGARTGCDVGANTGWYATYFALQPSIEKVFAFEGDPSFEALARRNLALNGPEYLSKATLIYKFVGSRDDDQWVSLDFALGDAPEPIVLKIDVDGGEMDVLRGAASTLRDKDCRLIIETHTAELERECLAFLEGLGYRTRVIKNGWYRGILPEGRVIEHNRWMTAVRA